MKKGYINNMGYTPPLEVPSDTEGWSESIERYRPML